MNFPRQSQYPLELLLVFQYRYDFLTVQMEAVFCHHVTQLGNGFLRKKTLIRLQFQDCVLRPVDYLCRDHQCSKRLFHQYHSITLKSYYGRPPPALICPLVFTHYYWVSYHRCGLLQLDGDTHSDHSDRLRLHII